MRGTAGQVAREALRPLNWLASLLLLLLLTVGGLAWLLANGPVELPFLARAIEARANAQLVATRVEIGRAAVGWAGFRSGSLTPIDLRLSGVRLREPDGDVRLEVAEAAVTVSVPALLRGRLVPETLDLRQPLVRLRRAADGEVSLLQAEPAADSASGVADLQAALGALMRPASADTPLGRLTRLRVEAGRMTLEDAASGRSLGLDPLAVDLRRLPAGGAAGTVAATLRTGEASVAVAAEIEATGTPTEVAFRVTVPELRPAALAGLLPEAVRLDAALRLEASGRVGLDGRLRSAQATLTAGAGSADLGGSRRTGFARLDLAVEATPDRVVLTRGALRLDGTAPPTLTATAEATRTPAGGWRGAATLELDTLSLADLGRHWPDGLARNARKWMVENLTAGTLRRGQWRAEGEVGPGFSAPRVTGFSGTVDVADATVHWLRPIPPAEGATGTVTFGLQEITLRVAAGRQSGGGVVLRGGTVRFDIEPDPQTVEMSFDLAGSVPDVLRVVQHPRLRLFERQPLPIKDPSGSLEGRLTVAFPLLADLPNELLRVRATARLRDLRMADVLLGRPLERGQFELVVDNEGMRVNGTGTLAAIDARIGVEMDFRSGPPTQVVMRETIQARTDARRLAALDLATLELVAGPIGLDIRTERRRSGIGLAFIRAELRDAALVIEPVGWSKPPGQPARAEAVLRFVGDAVQAIDSFRVDAPGAMVRGSVGFGRGSRPERIVITEAVVDGSRLSGEGRPPPRPGTPWTATLRGPVLDLRRVFGDDAPPAVPSDPANPGPSVVAEGRFDRVLLGAGRELAAVQASASVDGFGVVRRARLSGRAGAAGPFSAVVEPAGAGRGVTLVAEDAGALLGSFGVFRDLVAGRLSVIGRYDSNRADAALAGRAEMTGFSVRNAPGFAKLLQAMSLYGVIEALSGPGLVFSQLVAPFTLTPSTLALGEARAFSASLGLTATGTLDRRRQTVAMQGTIVPSYFFNSLLGNLPLVGRIFSPERGGGVFAATFRATGPVDDPNVSVNALAALTPGFLRGLFQLGEAAR